MSDLTALEKRKLEKLLGMDSGYVLNFSNKTLAEFIRDCTGCEIYDARYDYGSGSKANRLRAFWLKEDNKTVGTLMREMLDDSYELFGPQTSATLKEECRRIAGRLLGQTSNASVGQSAGRKAAESLRFQALQILKSEFLTLAAEPDRRKAGFALEALLNKLFKLFELQPREPFRVEGEQIDGSFILDGEIYLVESKWEQSPLAESELLVFRGKIEGKSTFTRGVFIALNGISAPALNAITKGKAPCFFVMNGHDLMMILDGAMNLTEFLQRRVRLLAETGSVCVPFSEVGMI
jgi:hypothetical protein